MSGSMLHGLGDCTPELNCGCMDFLNFGICEVCGETITGSHYHCSCGTTDVTGAYGHHSSVCHIEGNPYPLFKAPFHHCGPNGDCELLKSVE